MPTVTYDARSFMLDGRRLWLVGGSIPFSKLPRETWADRIHQAKLAGLNTVETPVFWSRHEHRPGRPDFAGDNDIRHFVKLVHDAGLWCVLRVGPYVGSGWDFGGLPPWILPAAAGKLRAGSPAFLDAFARFTNALIEQVRDLQVTSPGKGGPIIAVQSESSWTCGDETVGEHYLAELLRFLRESGVSVPTLSCNNLWQTVEGVIDAWAGNHDMLAMMRQLSCVRADQPRVVADFPVAPLERWSGDHAPAPAPWSVQRRLVETLAGGGQYMIRPFAGGHHFAFSAGRSAAGPAEFFTAEAGAEAPISPSGAHGPSLAMIRRVSTFASRFARVLANVDPGYQPITLHPGTTDGPSPARPHRGDQPKPAPAHSVVHSMGAQGEIVFVFRERPQAQAPDEPDPVLLLPDGSTVEVPMGDQAAAWLLFETNLTARAHLDYTNLNALAVVGKVFAAYGPAGRRAVFSINGSVVDAPVPATSAPAVIEHEGVHLLILNESHADTTYFTDDAVYVGIAGLAPDHTPIVRPGTKTFYHVSPDGTVTPKNATAAKTPCRVAIVGSPSDRAPLGEWSRADTADYTVGRSARFASIAGPSDMAALGAPFGYGWYRLTLRAANAGKVHAAFARAGDRLHLFLDGQPAGILGVGPGAASTVHLGLKKGEHHLVVLVENFGRFGEGNHLGEPKGLGGHLYELKEIKPGKPKHAVADPVEVLTLRSPIWDVRSGDATEPDRAGWNLGYRRKNPLFIDVAPLEHRCLLIADDKPIAFLDHAGPGRVVLDGDGFKGIGTLQLTPLSEGEAIRPEALLKLASDAVTIHECVSCLTEKAEWAFAKWEAPPAGAYAPHKGRASGPTWWRTTFKPAKTPSPLYLEPDGFTKGQVWINGKHLGRFFMTDPAGKPISGQRRHLIPNAWLKHGQPNDLVIFDEHGGSPGKAHLVYDHERAPLTTSLPGAPA
ncbi:MAG: beta-galactosidase [Phycisphaeraceae bacterium]|nr:MAG: beta-galactosidase [Phycisphaeraceae bacterium]